MASALPSARNVPRFDASVRTGTSALQTKKKGRRSAEMSCQAKFHSPLHFIAHPYRLTTTLTE